MGSQSQNAQKPRLMKRFHEKMRRGSYSIRTEKTYREWILKYIKFHGTRNPLEMGVPEVEAFLTDLATPWRGARPTTSADL